MARKKVSGKDDPFYIEQDEDTGEMFSKETLSGMLDMGPEEPAYQDKLVLTDKYGELYVMPLPQPMEPQARPQQADFGSGRPDPLPRKMPPPGFLEFGDSDKPPMSPEDKQKFIDELKQYPEDWYGVFQDFIINTGGVPDEVLKGLPPDAQEVLDYAKEDIQDFESGRPMKMRTKKFKPGKAFEKKFQARKFNPKLMETQGSIMKRLGENAPK